MESKIYNQEGKEVGKVTLPESVFSVSWNPDLVHQVVVSMESNNRTPVAHVKDRSEVRGGGKKPWRQKGTGRARHGSIRSPLWIGGGVTFGPRNERNFKQKINKKVRAKALFTALSHKFKDNEILFIDTLTFDGPKSARAREILDSLGSIKGFEQLSTKRKNNVLIALTKKDEAVQKSFANFGNVAVCDVGALNPVFVLKYKFIIITDPEQAATL